MGDNNDRTKKNVICKRLYVKATKRKKERESFAGARNKSYSCARLDDINEPPNCECRVYNGTGYCVARVLFIRSLWIFEGKHAPRAISGIASRCFVLNKPSETNQADVRTGGKPSDKELSVSQQTPLTLLSSPLTPPAYESFRNLSAKKIQLPHRRHSFSSNSHFSSDYACATVMYVSAITVAPIQGQRKFARATPTPLSWLVSITPAKPRFDKSILGLALRLIHFSHIAGCYYGLSVGWL